MMDDKRKDRRSSPGKVQTRVRAAKVKQAKPLKREPKTFPIVGLGASAGGLQALKNFFGHTAENCGMAFIVVVHMTPRQPSMLPGLLQKVTPLPVETARDGQCLEADHIYVVPPDKEISVFRGEIQLMDVVERHTFLPIDAFLRSLAHDQGSRAVAVVLSGTGTDGTLGAKEIKANDGLVLVQSETSADYDGMPRSAISSGAADIVLPPEEMPRRLSQYFAMHPVAQKGPTLAATDQKAWLYKICAILRDQIGHDFSRYKPNTLLRRINRRMSLNQIKDRDQYIGLLRKDREEVETLFRELLIGVTNFFRDPESFLVLKNTVLPELIDKLREDSTFRAWVPGCSTGEEVYSLAMIIREVLDNNPKRIAVQLFGTDIDDFAIDKARAGFYPASIAADVSEERLKRFFTREGDSFHIRKEIRESVIFSSQDVIKDPPFSRLHLLCCRNLLIYLETEAQKKLLPLFHYTLRPEGVLVLGSSESIGGFSNLFDVLDKRWKIFRRVEVPQELRQPIEFPSGPSTTETAPANGKPVPDGELKANLSLIIQKAVLDQFAPTVLLVDAKGNILFVQGRTGKYLETPSGPPTNNILDLARPGLRIELSMALRAAKTSSENVVRSKVSVKTNGDMQMIDLHVCPQHAPKEVAGRFLVVLEDVEGASAPGPQTGDPADKGHESSQIAALEMELQNTRESHQTTVEELESSNEELKSTNEELQSANEELQSTNEELVSSKEELQSLNEELQTVNAEQQSNVQELSAAHDDMRNLLNSTEIATIFVDNEMRIRRFTPKATPIVNLIPTDIGRPLQHVATNLIYAGMMSDLEAVLKDLIPRQTEVQTTTNDWYKMRIIPYRTTNNRIDGAVLTFGSINEEKHAQAVMTASKMEVEQARQLVRNIFDMNEDPLAVLDANGRMVIANASFCGLMKLPEDKITGLDVFDIKNGLLSATDLKARLADAHKEKRDFQIAASEIIRSDEASKYFINGRIIRTGDDQPYRILLQFLKVK